MCIAEIELPQGTYIILKPCSPGYFDIAKKAGTHTTK